MVIALIIIVFVVLGLLKHPISDVFNNLLGSELLSSQPNCNWRLRQLFYPSNPVLSFFLRQDKKIDRRSSTDIFRTFLRGLTFDDAVFVRRGV